jgi:hypothetical protein
VKGELQHEENASFIDNNGSISLYFVPLPVSVNPGASRDWTYDKTDGNTSGIGRKTKLTMERHQPYASTTNSRQM